MKKPRLTPRNLIVQSLLPLFLVGCAGEAAHRDGLHLLSEGKVEEGLAKLEQAAQEAPRNLQFKADLRTRKDDSINKMLTAADTARGDGRADVAAGLYKRVLGMQRDNPRARAGLTALDMDKRNAERMKNAEERLRKGNTDEAQELVRAVLAEAPGHREAKALQRRIDEMLNRELVSVPTLRSKFKKPVTLEFRDANLKMVFDALARTSGINFVFDRDVRSDLKTTIFVRQESVEDAIDLLLLPNQLDKKVLSENTVLVFPATPQKIKEYQELVIKTFYLGNADPKQTLALLKAILKTKDMHVDEKANLLVMRDTPEAIRLAEKLIAAQDVAEPEVMLEVEVLEVARSRILELGAKWPNQFELQALDPTPDDKVYTLHDLRTAGEKGFTSVTAPKMTINLRKDDTDTNTLASPRIRVKNREKAKVHIGDKVPVISASQTPSTQGPVFTESIQYLDVGLKLEVEPNVFLDDEVSIKIGLEVSSATPLAKTNSGSTPVQVSTRNATTVLRLKDGETQVLMGLIRDDEKKTANKVPGLGEIPILGHLFGSHLDDKNKTEIVLSITPHVVRNVNRPEAKITEFWSGTETAYRTKPVAASSRNGGDASAKPAVMGFTAPATPALPAPATPSRPAAQSAAQTAVQPPPGLQTDAAAGFPRAPEAPAGAAQLALSWQAPQEIKVGEQFTVTLQAKADQPIVSAALQIGFDPAAVKVLDVAEGELLKQGGATTTFTERVDPTGKVFVGVARGGAPGVSGEGGLVTLTLEAVTAQQQTALQLLTVSPVGVGNKIIGHTGQPLQLSINGPQ